MESHDKESHDKESHNMESHNIMEVDNLTNVNESVMGKELGVLSNEITYRKYLMEKINLKKLFRNISIVDYNAMLTIIKINSENEETEKIYLRHISDTLKIPISRVSRTIEKLRDKGMIEWMHDGKGENGTYIQITDRGNKIVEEQHEILNMFYGKIIEDFGKEKFEQMLSMVSEFEDIMTEEVKMLE